MARQLTIGRYQVGEKLGEGKFGEVYRAYDPDEKREVALKVLRLEASASPELVRRFQREAKLTATLQHPNIVKVFAAGKTVTTFYIVSALIRGETLANLIPRDVGVEPWRAVHLTIQLADALSCAHQHKIIHRDVKPGNIMVDEHDHLFLMDFGLATLLDQSLSQLTQPRTRMGTPAYMSPEQAMAGLLEVAERSDIYSAGATLYHMLTGRPPFLGAPDLVYHHVINTPPNPPSNYCHDLDPKLETICLTAMAKNPRERYRSSQEFAVRLREWLKALPHTQKPRSIRPVTPAHEEVSSLLRQSTLFLMDNARKEPLPPFVQEVTRAPGWRRLKIGALMLGVLLLAAALVAWSGLLPGGGQSNKPKGEGLFRNMNDNRPR